MSFRYSVELRDAGLDARVAAVGPSPILKIFSSTLSVSQKPKGELVSIELPKVWMSKAKNGAVGNTDAWKGYATGKGEAQSFRIYDNSGDTCHIEGAIPEDMKLDNENIAPGQMVTVDVFTIKSGNG